MMHQIVFMNPSDENNDYEFYMFIAEHALTAHSLYKELLKGFFDRTYPIPRLALGEEMEELIRLGFLRPKRYGYKFFPGGKFTIGFYKDIEEEVDGY